MKSDTSKILIGILNISIFLISLGWVALIGLFIYTVAGGNIESPLKISDPILNNSKSALITAVSYNILLCPLIIYLIYIIKKLLTSLISGDLFTRYQIAGFKLIGQLIIWFVVLNAIYKFIFDIIFRESADISINFSGFWLFIALGTFFMLLSKVFENARIMKEENDLTV